MHFLTFVLQTPHGFRETKD